MSKFPRVTIPPSLSCGSGGPGARRSGGVITLTRSPTGRILDPPSASPVSAVQLTHCGRLEYAVHSQCQRLDKLLRSSDRTWAVQKEEMQECSWKAGSSASSNSRGSPVLERRSSQSTGLEQRPEHQPGWVCGQAGRTRGEPKVSILLHVHPELASSSLAGDASVPVGPMPSPEGRAGDAWSGRGAHAQPYRCG